MTHPMQVIQHNHLIASNVVSITPWLDVKKINNATLPLAYQQICQKHNQQDKWILMVNPEPKSLKQLNHDNNVANHVLRVFSNKVKVDIDNIKKALHSGNCSAVILCDAIFSQEEIDQLLASAQQGKTKCILLNRLH